MTMLLQTHTWTQTERELLQLHFFKHVYFFGAFKQKLAKLESSN